MKSETQEYRSLEQLRILLNKQEAIIADVREECERIRKDCESTEEYQRLEKEVNELGERNIDLCEQLSECEEEIHSRYLNEGTFPSWSKTYGCNIRGEVIDAIKKTFKWSHLSGGTVETIVKKMIHEDTLADKKTQQIKAEIEKNNSKQHQIWDAQGELLEKAKGKILVNIDEEQRKSRELRDEIENVLALQKDVVNSAKNAGFTASQISLQKARVLEDYRENCIENFREVRKNLKTVGGV